MEPPWQVRSLITVQQKMLAMLLRLATLMLAGLCPLLAAAQTSAPVAGTPDVKLLSIDNLISRQSTVAVAGNNGQVVPLWASEDGRLLAIVGLSQRPGAPTLPPSPAFGGLSDLRIIDATNLFTTGLRWRPGHGLRADFVVGLQAQDSNPFTVFSPPGCIAGLCTSDTASHGAIGGTLGAGWTSAESHGLDVSFGLSWLDAQQAQVPLMLHRAPGLAGIDLGTLAAAGGAPLRLDSSLFLLARGSWRLDQGALVDLSAGLGRAEVEPLLWYGIPGSPFDVNQATLGLGIANGSLRGSIVGHVISADLPGLSGTRRWSGIDLGVSWRTPWRGEVSVGAQNLWSLPLDAHPPSEADSAQARMPYVQYRQDL